MRLVHPSEGVVVDGRANSRSAAAPDLGGTSRPEVALPTIFDICRPRPDVLSGTVADTDSAADLAQVLTGKASAE